MVEDLWYKNTLILPHDIVVKPNYEGDDVLINLLVDEQSRGDQVAGHHLKLDVPRDFFIIGCDTTCPT